MPKTQNNQVKGGCKKGGRSKRRSLAGTLPLSLFVRGKIPAKEYFRLTNQPFRG